LSRLAHEIAVRRKEVRQKHGIFPSIETLEDWLIFPDGRAKLPSDSRKSHKNTAFSRQSKCLTRSATENQQAVDAFRYGKISKPLTRPATEIQQAASPWGVAG
jgi:hypothetical protein